MLLKRFCFTLKDDINFNYKIIKFIYMEELFCYILLTKVLAFKQVNSYRTLILSTYKMPYIYVRLTFT
jgi:hypothetical protein